MSVETILLGFALCSALGALCAVGCWSSRSMSLEPSTRESRVDPILGAKDRIAIYDGIAPIPGPKDWIAVLDATGPLIPMPERLKTRAEMVDWMTKELPKLIAETPKTGV